jgi:hypothetical protein
LASGIQFKYGLGWSNSQLILDTRFLWRVGRVMKSICEFLWNFWALASFHEKLLYMYVFPMIQSNLYITTLDYMTTLTIRHSFGWPNFVVLIYLHTTTMTLVIRHFLGPICHIIEVINGYKWWDPLLFQGSYVINTSETCCGTFGNQLSNLYYGLLS